MAGGAEERGRAAGQPSRASPSPPGPAGTRARAPRRSTWCRQRAMPTFVVRLTTPVRTGSHRTARRSGGSPSAARPGAHRRRHGRAAFRLHRTRSATGIRVTAAGERAGVNCARDPSGPSRPGRIGGSRSPSPCVPPTCRPPTPNRGRGKIRVESADAVPRRIT